ncbi:glycosyltransferase family 4 protein [Thermicanus aegyptius]|uniref:glycosyltransferase family 4 protein n=1 Tax=Thermicanus aegyptius TaxID=94009 RepID=UPI000409DA96|nr:glycosyltransferase family 1 protein [Thermicanus aegyptius]
MKILIDGIWINKPRGLGRYLKEIIYALSKHQENDLEIVIAIPNKTKLSLGFDLPSFFSIKYFTNTPYPIWEQIVFPLAVRKVNPDIVFCPNNTIPFINLSKYVLVTIHDLIFEENLGRGLYQKIGNIYRRISLINIKKKRPFIITVSMHSKEHIEKKIGISPIVVNTPAETLFLNHYNKINKNTNNSKMSNNSMKIILHIGGISPHKNTERVISAFKLLNLKNTKLIILGMGTDNPISKRYKEDNIIFPGWVNDEDIVSIYSKASILVFPSLKEGYGLPIIEGFSAGVPVITSNIPPMSEVAGNAAHLVDPFSIESIANGIKYLLENPDYAKRLIILGRMRLESINSNCLRNQLVELFREVYYESKKRSSSN